VTPAQTPAVQGTPDRVRALELPDFDMTDAELRATGSAKWTYGPPDALPAWVAEMDVRPCPAVQDALRDAVDRGAFGYPGPDSASTLPEATAAFLAGRFGWDVPPGRVISTGDVMAGIRIILETLCEPAPVVVPLPSYPPFLDIVPVTGRELVGVPCLADEQGRAVLDMDRIDAALVAGARTILLASPYNPVGRALTTGELEAVRDTALRHGARVISDEIHAPLVLPGATHVPYLSLEGTAEHGTAVVASSKAWNTPGLKCAQIVAGSTADSQALHSVPLVSNHGASSLGIVAAQAAYTSGEAWLDGLLEHLDQMRALFGQLMAERLPHVRWTPPEATYLAWADASATSLADPSKTALNEGKVMLHPGRFFGPGYDQFARVNLGTSSERLERVVDALAAAWPAG
jgi:cystathionine beta-lyase